MWETFARERGLSFTPPSGYPNDELAIEGLVDGIAIALTTRRGKKGSVETRVRAVARHAMVGRVEIRSRRWADHVAGIFRGRSTTGNAELDAVLSTFTSSDALLRVILDPRTIQTLNEFRHKPQIALVYENGAISFRWAGVEQAPALLDAAAGLAAYLAVTGSEVSPYR